MSARTKRYARGALLFLSLLFMAACGVEQKRSGLPPSAQAAIDNITNDLSRGDYDKIYAEATDEWRRTAPPDQSRAHLERIRTTLGNVLSRQQLDAREQLAGLEEHMLMVNYNTKFERGDAIETFELIERQSRWLLVRYAVRSNALR
ncbi:MAG TPA: DUF4019 domain-containing protein [Pyrinomonadaceae bacterium]|jgi:hypothetical protein